MGSIPRQRKATFRSTHLPVGLPDPHSAAWTSLPGNPLAPAAARRFVRAALAEWTGLGLPGADGFTDRVADDAVILVNELVTNAVVHAGTNVELVCHLEEATEDDPAALVVEVSDHHPARVVRNEPGGSAATGSHEFGRGLHLVAALSACWGVTYRTGLKTVWARIAIEGVLPAVSPGPAADAEQALQRGLRAAEILAPVPRRSAREYDSDWINRGALSFLAEASDLLTGQFDEDMIAALAAQLLVPRLADWCAVWLEEEGAAPRLARVWHQRESSVEELGRHLEKEPPPALPESARGGPVPVRWPGVAGPEEADGLDGTGSAEGVGGMGGIDGTDGLDVIDGADRTEGTDGSDRTDGTDGTDGTDCANGAAVAYRLIAGGRGLGTLMLGRAALTRFPDEVTGLVEDFVRRVALAVAAARQYTRQANISHVLQRALLPGQMAEIPGVAKALVYEPRGQGVAGGDFYDVFPGAPGSWSFSLGDVQGNGPEAAVVTGLVRPWLRLLAREGRAVGEVLGRLNGLLLDDAVEAAEATARMAVVSAGASGAPGAPVGPLALRDAAPQPRFLSLLYGELVPLPPEDGGGVRCTLACAGHPLPLVLRPDGSVRPAAGSQMLLGVLDDVTYESETFVLQAGDTLLCVTDGVTERRSGRRMFDDADGLAAALGRCVGLSAQGVAERIMREVHDFSPTPPDDDLALLVLQAF
ncbi:SpoIIE family protein phosphatase [Streptomyces sp. ISL-99]|uniref:ATP-binding SpoIIE family protein phosphatase n=1 Tax=Streptomyces sp. ISL-99 TaxID=2819193 RepID=UPI001BE60D99|nr:ATP-binding SpoIIE family protein phosphatase [Streptomyces sp. ISL-99]MBT2527084.1 SpoIIE family protein phosphatase [Streptomyces sp. ISL-99]